MPVKQHKNAEDGDVSGAENDHQGRNLVAILDHQSHRPVRHAHLPAAAREHVDQQREEKFQWVDVEQYDKQQHTIEHDAGVVLQTVTAEKLVLTKPD